MTVQQKNGKTILTLDITDYAIGSRVADEFHPLDVSKPTDEAWLHMLAYGVQRFVNDATGGKDKTAEDKAKIAKEKIEQIEAETFSVRKSGTGEPPINRFVRAVIRGLLGDKSKEEYKKLPSDDGSRDDYLMGKFDALPAESDKPNVLTQALVTAKAEQLLEADRAAKAAKRETLGDVKVSI